MSRIANNPISIPTGVEIKIEPGKVVAKGPKGEHYLNLHSDINLQHKDDILQVEETKEGSWAINRLRHVYKNANSSTTCMMKSRE